MKEYKLNIRVGDLISVGRFRNVQTKIKAIETDENGQPVVYTSCLLYTSPSPRD